MSRATLDETGSPAERRAAADETTTGRARWTARGGVGGLIATVVMTVYRIPTTRSLPPTAEFWAQYVAGGDPDDHPVPALLLHLLYGFSGGAAFGALYPAFERRASSDTAREAGGTALGALYGLAMSVFGARVVLGRVLGQDLDGTERLVFHVGHLVYGLTLGSWVASESRLRDLLGETEAGTDQR
ncbi:hypothetical protein [Halomicrobium urmianum]|uniref:hypothetical protein n=1 Tax=Halomicrobium urmianum TaxID=1586233 RepID=UPI001CD9AC78|nr:hypothetical protein [Halomicrobium urmianum]